MRSRLFLVVVLALAFVPATGMRALAVDAPPTVSITTTHVLTAWQKVVFNEPVTGINASNLQLRVSGAATPLPSTMTCRNAVNANVPCNTGSVSAAYIRGAQPLIPGQMYDVVVNPTGATTIVDQDAPADAAPTTVVPFHASGSEQETSVAATYRWRQITSSEASGGTYRLNRAVGATATFRFTGTAVTWLTRRSPAQGKASVTIDNGPALVIDNYNPTAAMRQRTYKVPLGDHVIVIRVLGLRNRWANASWIAVDGFRVGGVTTEEADSSTFRRAASSQASRGHLARADAPGDSSSFRFRGTGIAWYTMTGPYEGNVFVRIDGKYLQTVNNYSSAAKFGVRRTISGLSDRVHTLSLTIASTRDARSRGNMLGIDRWLLRAEVRAFKGLGAWVDVYDMKRAYSSWTEIRNAVDDMRAHGVKTLYIQTGRYNTPAIALPTQVYRFIESAHAAGIKVIGWYLPAYSEHLSDDVAKTVAVSTYRTPRGHRFDGLGIDIEYRVKNDSKSEFFRGITSHLGRVRARVGIGFPVAAITFAPLDMDLWVAGWSGFPWSSVGKYANVVMPMGYWSNRLERCADRQYDYCPGRYTRLNTERARAYTGLPVHEIGGVGSDSRITAAQVESYVNGCKAASCIGGSYYDYQTTKSWFWPKLEKLNS